MGCSPKRFSRPPRCDRFDTPPCPSIISVFYAPVNRLIRARSCFVLRRAFPLFSALFYCRRYAATLLLALCRLPFPCLLPSFVVAAMPQRFCLSFTFCRFFPRPFRFLSPPCAEVRLFALRFVPPLIVAFSRARKRAGAFCCSRTDGESLRAKKPPR